MFHVQCIYVGCVASMQRLWSWSRCFVLLFGLKTWRNLQNNNNCYRALHGCIKSCCTHKSGFIGTKVNNNPLTSCLVRLALRWEDFGWLYAEKTPLEEPVLQVLHRMVTITSTHAQTRASPFLFFFLVSHQPQGVWRASYHSLHSLCAAAP